MRSRGEQMASGISISHDAMVQSLGRPNAYRDRPARIEQIESHISHLFLTERFVYKLKKPVRFGFLDFSSLEAQKRACDDEVRLNRRFASHVYWGVLPVVALPKARLKASQVTSHRVASTCFAISPIGST